MSKEEWRPIPIKPWKDLYEVSNKGNIRHAPRLVAQRIIDGYKCVTLRHLQHRYTVRAHRVMAAAFIRPPKPEEQINHKNSDRADNSLSNLEWVTPSENVQHGFNHGRGRLGVAHPLGKINHVVAFQMIKNGSSYSSVARHFGATVQAVSHMVRRAKKHGRF